MTVTLSAGMLSRYQRFTLYNSPYVAHDHGHAVDLYPGVGPERTERAPSPVAGEVLAVRTVTAPSKPYAVEKDHLVLVDVGDYVARILHVEPAVEAGDRLEVGDSLGTLVRAGYFAPWVDNHIHLEFRDPAANLYRASGSVRLAVDPALRLKALSWDGTGTVVEAGDTYALLDSPAHPDPGAYFVGVESTDAPAVLDGGFPHYEGGGLLRTDDRASVDAGADATVVPTLAGEPVGTADGRDVTWEGSLVANGDPITGIALCCAQDERFGAKLVGRDLAFSEGETVTVGVER
jgi:hypothetical protein